MENVKIIFGLGDLITLLVYKALTRVHIFSFDQKLTTDSQLHFFSVPILQEFYPGLFHNNL